MTTLDETFREVAKGLTHYGWSARAVETTKFSDFEIVKVVAQDLRGNPFASFVVLKDGVVQWYCSKGRIGHPPGGGWHTGYEFADKQRAIEAAQNGKLINSATDANTERAARQALD